MPNINDLPLEILGLIFISFYQDLERGEVDIGLAAVCLTCKRWSDFALSTPELWSLIEIISVPSTTPRSNLPSYTKVFSWLDRSKNWPLALAVRGEWLNERQSTSIRAILPLLIAHSHRWRRVFFGFGFWFQPMHVELPHTFIAPILESIEVASPTDATTALMWLGKAVNLHSYYITIGGDRITGQSLKPVTSPIELLTMKIQRGTRCKEPQEPFHSLRVGPLYGS
ncbi:hypothetical protein K443DRAFT_643776 [Laccaria amethystina LaAM-08-1]|uniref:F-box domain-containing protein n=1 Tax=Laccaria amethystina LaAM-08-1 TaxID=1095629 RepID=A0A0C9WR12_9AGAR|nr:hypothetical protein K443DRAFT_643776 [Laccaria amethystina LaAM-08-1]